MRLLKKTLDSAESIIRQSRRIVIIGHVNPDADTLGAVLSLSLALKAMNKDVVALSADGVKECIAFLPGSEFIQQTTERKDFDLTILCDLEALKRSGVNAHTASASPKMLVIDHHIAWERLGDIRLIDTKASATCTIIYRLLKHMNVPITVDIATCLLAGIVTDTGSFRFPNTNPSALKIASELVRIGADITNIYENAYENRPLAAIKLLGVALLNMKTKRNNEIVWSCLSLNDFKEHNAEDEHTEGIISALRMVKGSKAILLLREVAPMKVRVSLRGRPPVNVAAIAQQFGGGGHLLASGCTFNSTLEEAEQTLLQAVEQWMDSLSSTSQPE